jgi:hypothetical protein
MLDNSQLIASCNASFSAADAALSAIAGAKPLPNVPKWTPRPVGGSVESGQAVIDRLVRSMAGAGHSVAALSLYLGLREADVRKKIAALGLPQASEKPLRRPTSKHPWTVSEVRRLIALWLDEVSVGSIAATLARSSSGIHSKRRWLGLGVRDRKGLSERTPTECRALRLPWKPTVDVSEIVAWLRRPELGARAPAAKSSRWVLGRDGAFDMRCSILAFAGLRSSAIADRLRIEFGLELSVKAVDNRISRLQIVRDRAEMIDAFDEEVVQRRAAEVMREVGATLRQCAEINRSFWYCRQIGGSRSICREFLTSAKYAPRRAARACCDVLGMAA